MRLSHRTKLQKKSRKSLTNSFAQKLRRVAIVAAPPVRMLEAFGPAEVFVAANRLRGGQPVSEVEIVSATEDRMIASHCWLTEPIGERNDEI